jgi:hypothetical protein
MDLTSWEAVHCPGQMHYPASNQRGIEVTCITTAGEEGQMMPTMTP